MIFDQRYVTARRVLLDALTALDKHRDALVLVGAQAVYLRTQSPSETEFIAPFTTDGDLAIDPAFLGQTPQLELLMEGAGFHLLEVPSGGVEPGIWISDLVVDGVLVHVPIDLIVPEAASDGQGRRGARLGPHGNRAARRAVGLEAALFDNSVLDIGALDASDARLVSVKVAGVAALLVAKSHKIHDRVMSGRIDRLSDKDASDVYRIMQTTQPAKVASTMQQLVEQKGSREVTHDALMFLRELFSPVSGEGIAMAQRALLGVVDPATVDVVSRNYVQQLLAAL